MLGMEARRARDVRYGANMYLPRQLTFRKLPDVKHRLIYDMIGWHSIVSMQLQPIAWVDATPRPKRMAVVREGSARIVQNALKSHL